MAENDPVARMARHRAAMTLALAEGLSLKAATDRLAHERWLKVTATLKRSQCGTGAPASATDVDPAVQDRPEPWWQRL